MVKTVYQRERVQTPQDKVSLTEQAHLESSKIENIIGRMKRGQYVITPKAAMFGEFDSADDFTSAQNKIISAKRAFDSLAPGIRAKFKNNPAELLRFLSDEGNREEAEKLGLIERAATSQSSTSETPQEQQTTAGVEVTPPVQK